MDRICDLDDKELQKLLMVGKGVKICVFILVSFVPRMLIVAFSTKDKKKTDVSGC